MDIRYHRTAERIAMRGFVLSLLALGASVMLVCCLIWLANVWLAGRGDVQPRLRPPVAESPTFDRGSAPVSSEGEA